MADVIYEASGYRGDDLDVTEFADLDDAKSCLLEWWLSALRGEVVSLEDDLLF